MSSRADPLIIARDLLRCRSVTPAEGGALNYLDSTLKAAGFTVYRITFREPGADDVENLYARIGKAAPNLMFAGHTDVVAPGDENAWTHPPFAGEVANGELYGRGAVDMKGGIACAVAAVLDYLSARTGKPKGSISFLITGDEEGVAVNGTPKLLQWALEHGEKFDHCILGEPSNVLELGDTIKIGRRGSLNAQLIVTGKQGHVAYPQRAENPIRGLVTLIRRCRPSRSITAAGFFRPPIWNSPRSMSAIRTVNLIPGEARARFNIRFNDKHTLTIAERTDRAARGQGGRRQDQVFVSMGAVECRRVRHQTGSVHRFGVGFDREYHRPQAGAVHQRRHLRCTLHHRLLPGGGIRPGRADHASGRRARAGRRSARADQDIGRLSRGISAIRSCPLSRGRTD